MIAFKYGIKKENSLVCSLPANVCPSCIAVLSPEVRWNDMEWLFLVGFGSVVGILALVTMQDALERNCLSSPGPAWWEKMSKTQSCPVPIGRNGGTGKVPKRSSKLWPLWQK